MKGISSITQGPRQTNIEILRILATFMVLVVHADYWALGGPSYEDFVLSPANAWMRTIVASITIVCVNLFILISGWFGIKSSVKGLSNFIFQCAFFLFGSYVIMLVCHLTTFSVKGFLSCFCLTRGNWFIQAYVGLYILSPVLNAYIEKESKNHFRNFLIIFYLLQTIWGRRGALPCILQGYS